MTYRVLIKGIKADADANSVRTNIAKLFKISIDDAGRILEAKIHVVRDGLIMSKAAHYHSSIEAAGANCMVEPEARHDLGLEMTLPESVGTTPGIGVLATGVGNQSNEVSAKQSVFEREPLNTTLQPRSYFGTASMFFGVTALPFGLGFGWLMSVQSGTPFGTMLKGTIPLGLMFGILFGLTMAAFFKGATIALTVRDKDEFVSQINIAMSQIGFNPATTSGNFLSFKPSFQAGLMSGKFSVVIHGTKATIVGPSLFVRKLQKRLGAMHVQEKFMSQDTVTTETTDSWPFGKILKHVLLPKPKGSPKAGKKEITLRLAMGAIFGAIGLYFALGGKSLPGCDQSDTKDLVGKIINDLPVARAQNTQYVALKNVVEQGYNKTTELRSCQAILVTTAGENSIQYSVKWQDKTKGLIYVAAQLLPTNEPVAEMDDINQKVASDAVRQFEIAKRNGTPTDVCVQAMGVSAAYLQAKDESNYASWKATETQACRAIGMPGY